MIHSLLDSLLDIQNGFLCFHLCSFPYFRYEISHIASLNTKYEQKWPRLLSYLPSTFLFTIPQKLSNNTESPPFTHRTNTLTPLSSCPPSLFT